MDDSEPTMLRWVVLFLVTVAAIKPAMGADESVATPERRHATKIPAGVARPHSKIKMATTPHPAPRRDRADRSYAEETPDLLFTPAEGIVRRVVPWFHAPVLPGSSTLPGYYGSTHSYDYQGSYYGGPNPGTWDRLPYACGVYGYC
jgi:hypothetical protein